MSDSTTQASAVRDTETSTATLDHAGEYLTFSLAGEES